jgi:hypothetical protein
MPSWRKAGRSLTDVLAQVDELVDAFVAAEPVPVSRTASSSTGSSSTPVASEP